VKEYFTLFVLFERIIQLALPQTNIAGHRTVPGETLITTG